MKWNLFYIHGRLRLEKLFRFKKKRKFPTFILFSEFGIPTMYNFSFYLCVTSYIFLNSTSFTFIIVSENLNAGNWFCLLIPSLIRINSRKHCRGRFNFEYKCKVNYIFSIIPNLISNFLIKTAADGLFPVILIATEKRIKTHLF